MSPRWSGLLAAHAGLLAACAQSHDGHADIATRSGTRLRLRWLESDGMRVVLGLHDAQLGLDCTVRTAADGELYCFPGTAQPQLFVDATCSELATPAESCAPPPALRSTLSSLPDRSATTTSDSLLRCTPTRSVIAHSDATCTRPYVYGTNSCEPHAGPVFARLDSDPCHVSVHAVAREPEALATPFAQSGSKCLPLGNGPSRGYAVQEVVDPALFAPMNERVE